jgi:Mg2+-importing ATPase
MVFFGPISSIFDILTFCLMWWVFQANVPEAQTLFQSGWFIEGLLSQTLIVHMIRTRRIPFVQSRAAWPLFAMTLVVMLVGIALPFSPLAGYLQLQALPLSYFPWLIAILAGYMTLTQMVKASTAVATAGNNPSLCRPFSSGSHGLFGISLKSQKVVNPVIPFA